MALIDREGPRGNAFNRGWSTFLSWASHPIDHIVSSLASDGWTPALKLGDSHKGAIIVRKSNHNLYYYDKDGNLKLRTSISTGKNSGLKLKEGDSRTPVGKFSISLYEPNRDPNTFGHNRFLRLNTPGWLGIGIHGDANQPERIGTNASHGCIRMPNGELIKLTDMLKTSASGTPVYILDENDNYKRGGRLIPKHLNKSPIVKLPEVTVTAINPNRFAKNSEMYNYAMGVNNMRNTLMNDYNFSDSKFADISKLAINLAGRESNYGLGFSYNTRKFIPDSLILAGHTILRGEKLPISRGVSLIKFYKGKHPQFNPNFSEYGLSEDNVKNNSSNQGKATAIYLSYLDNKVSKPIHWSDGSLMSDIDKRNIAFHMGKIPTDFKNDKENKSLDSTSYIDKYNKNKIIR